MQDLQKTFRYFSILSAPFFEKYRVSFLLIPVFVFKKKITSKFFIFLFFFLICSLFMCHLFMSALLVFTILIPFFLKCIFAVVLSMFLLLMFIDSLSCFFCLCFFFFAKLFDESPFFHFFFLKKNLFHSFIPFCKLFLSDLFFSFFFQSCSFKQDKRDLFLTQKHLFKPFQEYIF